MRRAPKPPPKMSDLVLPAMANPATPPRATKRPQGRVRQKSCMGNQEGSPLLLLVLFVSPRFSSDEGGGDAAALPGSAPARTTTAEVDERPPLLPPLHHPRGDDDLDAVAAWTTPRLPDWMRAPLADDDELLAVLSANALFAPTT